MLTRGQTTVFSADKRAVARVDARGASRVCTRVVAAPVSRRVAPVVCAATAEAPVYKGDLLNKTYYPTSADTAAVSKPWFIIDAKGQTLGRLATLAATYIRGKHAATYSPSMDMGAYVVVINAEQVVVSGNKTTEKVYFSQKATGRPGSGKLETFKNLQQRLPERIIERAVRGMLPKGPLGRRIRLHLKVYKGEEHPHGAQQPTCITNEISRKAKESPAGVAALAAKKAEAK